MAFEAFLEGGDPRPRRRRRLTYAVSLAVHAALLAGGIAYSFWHVEEITPPRVHVTFMAATPPPPAAPPPPPAGGSAEAPKKKATPKVKPTLTALVQPPLVPPKKEQPKPDPDDDDPAQAFAGSTKGGTAGGTIGGTTGGKIGGTTGGTVGGAVGGTGPKPTGPRKLAPQIGALQKESGEDPDFPALLRRSGRFYVVLANICVSRTGNVDGVTILQGADTLLDGNVVSAVKKWRYRPLMADNQAVPFCYFGRFEFKSN
jgi:periplasmic protein TonB